MKKILFIILSGTIFLINMQLFAADDQNLPGNEFQITLPDKIVKVGLFPMPGYHNFDQHGILNGYGYEYLQNIRRYTPWVFEYSSRNYGWPEMLDMLKTGRIDMVTGMQKTPEREEVFAFSQYPVGQFATTMTVKAGNAKYLTGDYAHWNGIRVGVLRNSSKNASFERFAQEKGFSWTPVYYENNQQMSEDLQKGVKIDAAVTSDLRRLLNEWVFEQFDVSNFYIAVRKTDQALLADLNFAMEQLETQSPDLRSRLRQKYYAEYSGGEIAYTAREKKFIERMRQSKHIFTTVLNPDNKPFSWFENGEYHGIFKDIADEIVERTGLPLKFIPARTREEYFQLCADPQTDIVWDSGLSYAEAERLHLVLSESYFTASVSMLARKDTSGSFSNIAVVSPSHVNDILQKHHPFQTAKTRTCKSVREAIDLVSSGQCDAACLYTRSAEYAVQEDIHGVLAANILPQFETAYSIAIRESRNPLLPSILNKAALSISPEFVQSLRNKYTPPWDAHNSLERVVHRHPWLFIGPLSAILILLTGFFLFHLKTRRKLHRLGIVFSNLPLRYFVIDDKGTILQHYLGDPTQLINSSFETLDCVKNEEVRRLMQEKTAEVIASGEPITVTYQLKKEETRSALISRIPHSVFGCPAAIWISQDITAYAQEQKRRQSLQSMWKAVVDAIPAILFVKDADNEYRYISANQKLASFFGLPVEAIVGRRGQELFKEPSDMKRVRDGDVCVIESGKVLDCYETLHDPEGIVHHFKTTKIPTMNEEGHRILIQMSLDITEFQELAEVRQIVSYAFEQLFSADDLSSGIEAILKRVCEFIGFTRAYVCYIDKEEDAAKVFVSYVPAGEKSLMNEGGYRIEKASELPVYKQLSEMDKDQSFDFDLTNKFDCERVKAHMPGLQDKIHQFDLRGLQISYVKVKGKLWGHVGFITQYAPPKKLTDNEKRLLDMTAHIIELAISRRQTMAQLELALHDAQAADKAKSFFLASMSHEIRTPLNAVIGFAELLKDQELDTDTQNEYLTSIALAGNALLQLINDILDLSKLDAGQIEFVTEKVDFNEFCNELAAVFQNGAEQKNLKLFFDTDGLPALYIDQQRIRQILFNLIGNAIKFTHRGGITVSADFQRNTDGNGTLTLKVADSGIGISPEDAKRLFTPFVQLSRIRAINSHNNGTGLGLSIVKKMIAQMGGSIKLESKVNEGSTFIIVLPNVRYEIAEVPVFKPFSGVEPGLCPSDFNPNILLVDDTALNLKVLGALLKRLRISYATATSGREALEKMKTGNFNIVLTDLLMPEMSGEDLARAIRKNPNWEHVKIGVVTAESDQSAYEHVLFDRILAKPISRDDLYDAIYGR